MRSASGRHVIGVVTIDLVKFLKTHERTVGKPLALDSHTRALLDRRVSPTEWIALESFLALLSALDEIALHGDEQRALDMGAAGGTVMRGLHKTYAVAGDPKSSVVAMRHAWRAHYDFGRLSCEPLSDRAVQFTVDSYPDMPMVHGMMTVGWGLAAARAGGSPTATATVVERPWTGSQRLQHIITF